jgi:hypothetical protein
MTGEFKLNVMLNLCEGLCGEQDSATDKQIATGECRCSD